MRCEWTLNDDVWHLAIDGDFVLTIAAEPGCTDTFTPVGEGAFLWTRTSATPVDRMTMTVRAQDAVRYWQVPAVNYNGNGWGRGAQYTGFGKDDEPWAYAWHRTAIPACTYAESEKWAVSLFGTEEGGMSGSIWTEEGKACQSILWPEQEGPKVLFKRCWMEPYQGTMEMRSTFSSLLHVSRVEATREGLRSLLDFAWGYFHREVTMEKTPEMVEKLDNLFFRSLYQRLFDGVTGFQTGMHWVESENAFIKSKNFEMGFTGQNISLAATLLRQYQKYGDADLRDKALAVLDSWVKFARRDNGLMLCKLFCDPNRLDSVINGDIPITLDACNLGTGATYFFKAARLCDELGISRPEYRRVALDLCDFALRTQQNNGELAKSWYLDGAVDSRHGSVGMFLVLPLFDAYEATGEKKYLDGALKGCAFYYGEFARNGYTTAGALDSYCIDKESGAPLLRGLLTAYHITGDTAHIAQAEDVAYYLATWQWHYTIRFPEGAMAREVGFDSYGSTSVSAAHNALDHYGVYWVPEYLELAELTGKDMWRQRARALWYSGTELLSDGTMVVKGRVRPAGGQDESIRHTRWGRPDGKYFTTSEWLTNWQGSFRQVTLDRLSDWSKLR